jgi:peptidoglycan/LPS O-acetylase OafA/YrhL
MAKLGHRPGLDGLRGVAVLLVIAYHAAPDVVPGGFLGVDLFFVLSGFLITSLLLAEWERTGTVGLGAFYVRRARRLLPALVAFLLGLVTYGVLVDRDFLSVTLRWLPFTYLTNGMIAFDVGRVAHGHIWSLAAEEQFYFLWPPLLIVLLRSVPPRRVVAITAALTATAAVVPVVLWAGGDGWVRLYYGPDTHATPILLGCLLGELWTWGMVPVGLERHGLLALAGLAGAVVTLSPPDRALYVGGYALVAIAGAVLVLAVVRCPSLARRFEHPALVRIGVLSYAMYLWHPFLLQIVGNGWLRWLAVLATYPVAVASMRVVERPFRVVRRPVTG